MPNVGGNPFGMVIRADPLMEFFFFDGGCLGKVTKKGGGGGRDGCEGG